MALVDVGQLHLDLDTIAKSSIDKACLLQFLLARTYSADVILETFLKSIAEQESLPTLARMFDLMHATIARNLLARRAKPVIRKTNAAKIPKGYY